MTPPHPAPDSPDWPCRTGAMGTLPGRLVTALYLLARDHVQPGDLEQALLQSAPYNDVRCAFTNPHLHQLARSHAQFLLEPGPVPVPERRTTDILVADVLNVQVNDGGVWEGGEVPVEVRLGADDGTEELKLDLSIGHLGEVVGIRLDVDRLRALLAEAEGKR